MKRPSRSFTSKTKTVSNASAVRKRDCLVKKAQTKMSAGDPFDSINSSELNALFQLKCNYIKTYGPAKFKTNKIVFQNVNLLLDQLYRLFSVQERITGLKAKDIDAMVDAIGCVIFREFPIHKVNEVDSVKVTLSDKHWTLYDKTYQLLELVTGYIAHCFSYSFIYKLVVNLSSPDRREREFSRDILWHAYNHASEVRSDIRCALYAAMSIRLCSSELLDLLYNIIEEFPSLSSEALIVFDSTIIPMHSHPEYNIFHEKLVRIVFLFFNKNPRIIQRSVPQIFALYPISNRSKQSFFLMEIGDILISFPKSIPKSATKRALGCFNLAITSGNKSIQQTALSIISSREFGIVLSSFSNEICNLMLSIKDETKSEDADIRALAAKALSIVARYADDVKQNKAKNSNFEAKWKLIFNTAKKKWKD